MLYRNIISIKVTVATVFLQQNIYLSNMLHSHRSDLHNFDDPRFLQVCTACENQV